jgi:amino acid transporter
MKTILIVLLTVAGLVADGILFAVFHEQKNTRRTTQWSSFGITLILTMMMFFVITALYMPMVRLPNDLS